MEVPMPIDLKQEEKELYDAYKADDEGLTFGMYVEKHGSKKLLKFNKDYQRRKEKLMKRGIIIN